MKAFDVSAATIAPIGRGERGAGARVSNRMMQSVSLVWQKRVLEEANESSDKDLSERCAICFQGIDDDDESIDLDCLHTFHRSCVDASALVLAKSYMPHL